jgi:polynucleotide 5'-hydroxyl-kinase GRC3/NOL9
MLSAIAARKAALAQSIVAPSPSHTSSMTTRHNTPLKKRKSPTKVVSRGAGPSERKPRKKVKNGSRREPSAGPPLRRTAAPNRDVNIAYSEDEDAEFRVGEIEDSDGIEDPDDLEDGFTLPTPSFNQTRRPWSPSHPLVDSSDEEKDEVSCSKHPSLPTPALEPVTLSSYMPDDHINFFPLSMEELSTVDSASSLTSRCAIILRPEETICLLGTCTLNVIYGTIMLLGACLTAPSHGHRIFAPQSSPLPIIRCTRDQDEEGRQTLAQRSILPRRIDSELRDGDALLVIEELHTGVEALGKVCRNFDGVFHPPRWVRSSPTHNASELGLLGVHLVCLSLFLDGASFDFETRCADPPTDCQLCTFYSVTDMGRSPDQQYSLTGLSWEE